MQGCKETRHAIEVRQLAPSILCKLKSPIETDTKQQRSLQFVQEGFNAEIKRKKFEEHRFSSAQASKHSCLEHHRLEGWMAAVSKPPAHDSRAQIHPSSAQWLNHCCSLAARRPAGMRESANPNSIASPSVFPSLRASRI